MDADDIEALSVEEKVDWIHRTITTFDVLDMAELEAVNGKIRSPWNEDDHTPSCHLYQDHFWDFSRGRGGDVIDLVQALTGKSWTRAVRILMEGAERIDASLDRVQRVVKAAPTDHTAAFDAEPTLDHVPPVWGLAGVPDWYTDQLIEMGNLKATHERLLMPHRHKGSIPGVKIRYMRFKASFDNSQWLGLYSPTPVVEGLPWAVICEGESDAWAMDAHLFNRPAEVFALPGGAGLWRDAWLEQLEPYERIYTCFDNDHAGVKATETVRSAVGWGRWRELAVPQLINDAREALSRGWQPRLG